MTSNINTSSINQNYPIADINQSTQGFRDNFTNIVSALSIAANEITTLQSSLSNMGTSVSTNTSNITQLNSSLTQANTSITSLATQITSLQDSVTSITGSSVSIGVDNGNIGFYGNTPVTQGSISGQNTSNPLALMYSLLTNLGKTGIIANSSLSSTLQNIPYSIPNIVDMGADITGSNDCTSIINSASSISPIVIIPPGTFKISSNITANKITNTWIIFGTVSNISYLPGNYISITSAGISTNYTSISMPNIPDTSTGYTPVTGSGTIYAKNGALYKA